MKVSFTEFILQYLDDWNLEARYLADDLEVYHQTLNAWMYRGRIPNSKNIEVIEDYFGEEFNNVVFDGKEIRRKFKIIRTDGSSKVYDTADELNKSEGIAKNTIERCCSEGDAIRSGRNKGCLIERFYTEVE